MPRETIDGNDVLAVRAAIETAVSRARNGEGPSFVECLTYRLRGHYEGDPAKYRELSELDDWKAKDPIQRFQSTLGDSGEDCAAEIKRLEDEARQKIEDAATAALDAPWPGPDDLLSQVFAG